ncbi:acyl-CoA dehydrogenase [Williamsia sp.]|uniref:acyl-CoA dehydrogenase n=1 Tax=Williamsia sp. TaxID=1872085 RepID=UPI002F928363
MRFLLEEEHHDLAASIESMLTRADLPGVIRSWNDGDTKPGELVWSKLAETGVNALLIGEDHGGIGAGAVEMVVAAHQLGRFAVPGPVAETIAAVPILLTDAGATDRLAALGEGELATVAHPPLVPYAVDAAVAGQVYVVADSTLNTGVATDPRPSVDLSRTLSSVDIDTLVAPVDPGRGFDFGALATAAQLIGLADTMLALAGEYAKTRKQFGREIGSFQAVKHHLADVAVAVEMARPLVHGAALSLDGNVPEPQFASRDVSAAKVAAGQAAYLASRIGLQVLGAIGYTQEHDLSLYLTKTRALITAWGTPAAHRARVLEAITA